MKFNLLISILSLLVLASCNIHSSVNIAKINQTKQTALKMKVEPPADFIPQNITIVSAGDSLTKGVGDSTNQGGYIPYLKDKLESEKGISNAHFSNFGIKGNRSDQLLKRIKSSEMKDAVGKADIVIVTIGGNDMMRVVRENLSSLNLRAFNNQKRTYQENLDNVLFNIKEENTDTIIVLVGLYNPFIKWFADIHEINQIIDDWNASSRDTLTKYSNTYFVEIDDIFQVNSEDLLYTDYFHPNDKGYELIANRVYETLKEEALINLANRF